MRSRSWFKAVLLSTLIIASFISLIVHFMIPSIAHSGISLKGPADGYEEDVTLFAGWNLVNFRVGDGILIYYTDYIMYYWNAPGGPYQLVNPYEIPWSPPYERENIGYWLCINQTKTVSTVYTGPIPRTIYLANGWNLVGFPLTYNTTTPTNIFAPLSYYTDYIIFYFTAPGGPYQIQSPTMPLEDNRGYWVWIDTNKTVTVP